MKIDQLFSQFHGRDTGVTNFAICHGDSVTEWYRAPWNRDVPHMLHSATKSFVGAAIGIAIGEGQLALDTRMVDLLPAEHARKATGKVEHLTIEDLLTMRTGHAQGTSGVVWRTLTSSWIDAYLGEHITGEVGQDFIYSSGSSHMLSVCFQNAVGRSVRDVLAECLFDPMGFHGWSWESDPEGYTSGGNGLSLRTVDFVKWGSLYLNGGTWNGQQLIPAEWIQESISEHAIARHSKWTGTGYGPRPETPDVASARTEGYGYQIWLRDGCYYASGMFGQYCIVSPATNTVIALNSSLSQDDSHALQARLTDFLGSASTNEILPQAQRHSSTSATLSLPEWLCGNFSSADGSTSFLLSETFPTDERITPPNSIFTVVGHDPAGPVATSAGVIRPHTFVGKLNGPSLHHSYTGSGPSVGTLERVGPWSYEARIIHAATPFVDRFTFTLEPDGSVLYDHISNVNSQNNSVPATRLVRQ